MLSLSQAHALLPGSVLLGDGALRVQRVHTDTRTLRPGDLFVALRGDRFDAHDFLPQAKKAGALAAVAERGLQASDLPGIEVPNSLWALQTLAAGWRQQLQLCVIAVTGSNGKTTVTQMIAAILRAWKADRSLATEGNFNNHIGVPLTLLRLRAHHEAAVLELGMNHPGEIAGLAAMSAPHVALVNNAQREHQEFMATVKAVAEENGAVIASLPPDGTAVFPADDAYAPLWRELAGARRTMTFALARDTSAADAVKADVLGRSKWQGQGWQVQATTPAGPLSFVLHMAGRHNVKNALGAAAAAVAAGAPMQAIESGLNAFRAVKGRSSLMACHLAGGAAASVSLVDDTYNANPDSVRAAIDVLTELPAPRWLILGDMGEVGDQGVAFHTEVGAYAREQGLEHLWCAGTLCEAAAQAFGPKARWFADTMTLVQALSQDSLNMPSVKSVLVKGSRFMAMERVVQALTSQGRQHAA
ncbi:MAG: UDP-N-acetylmuramoyl-tripeptide--D-alanyl-D-alanine ligase [Betaproteobacteria bacterium]|nr:UDP-N-acetylmuramoyl-tripeptide--D-alanyl-D-alanine ligase [Betaproteobacteria bacterium]